MSSRLDTTIDLGCLTQPHNDSVPQPRCSAIRWIVPFLTDLLAQLHDQADEPHSP